MQTRLKASLLLVLLFLGGCGTDLATKYWAHDELREGPPVTVIPGFLELGFAENRGMVFGMLNDGDTSTSSTVLLVVRIVIALGLTAFIAIRRDEPLSLRLLLALLAAGAYGNIIDALVNGHVTDFIHLSLGSWLDWPFLFNLADAYILIGVALLMIYSFRHRQPPRAEAT